MSPHAECHILGETKVSDRYKALHTAVMLAKDERGERVERIVLAREHLRVSLANVLGIEGDSEVEARELVYRDFDPIVDFDISSWNGDLCATCEYRINFLLDEVDG